MIQRLLVEKILKHATAFKWQLQGLGMLRTYISPAVRLHVWDSRYRVENVSMIHDHPWDFESLIIAGVVRQHRFAEIPIVTAPIAYATSGCFTPDIKAYNFSVLHCGPGGCQTTEPAVCYLARQEEEMYRTGEKYWQRATEIHKSLPEDGTVTLVTRTVPKGGNPDLARVFWPAGTKWGSAEPREATLEEVVKVTKGSLEVWFK